MKTNCLIISLIIILLSCQRKQGLLKSYINPYLIVDTFNIKTDSDTILYTSTGTIIKVSNKSFQFSGGKEVIGNIKILVQEVNSQADLVKSGITTISQGEIIQSGGMINLLAFKDTLSIELKPETTIEISMPRREFDDDWLLFSGEVNSMDYTFNWNKIPIDISTSYIDTIVLKDTVYNKKTDKNRWDIKQKKYAVYEYRKNDSVLLDTNTITWVTALPLEEYIPYQAISYSDTSIEKNNSEKTDSNAYFNNFIISRLGWTNVDRFLMESEVSDMSLVAKIDNKVKYSFEQVYLIFSERKIFISANKTSNGLFLFSSNYKARVKLPKGEKVLIVLECEKEGNYFYAIEKIELKNENLITLKPKPLGNIKLRDIVIKEL